MKPDSLTPQNPIAAPESLEQRPVLLPFAIGNGVTAGALGPRVVV